jgi:CheY-like chemotaxis protein
MDRHVRPAVIDSTGATVIALVEDSRTDEALTLRALQRIGLSNRVVVLGDGPQALEYLLRPGGPGGTPGVPHLVLLDLGLPGMDGIEVLRRLRATATTRLLPVVVLTSSDEDQRLLETYELGVNSYIRKPVDAERFAEVVGQVGLYWLVVNAVPEGGPS